MTTLLHWLGTSAGTAAPMSCPNCAARIVPRPVLDATPPGAQPIRLSACDDCGVRFFGSVAVGDYAKDPPGGDAALAFYLQQGANPGGMAVRLAALGRPAGTRYLEIGCGFGLGLDIARRTLGWEVAGFDPSPFAAAGRDLLGLPIEPRTLLPDDPLAGEFDVIHASEVLEHVADPLGLLRILHHALRRDGTLVLTTPAAELILPGTPEGLLIPLLSPGWHMVIQSAASLTALLSQAGFTAVQVTREGAQLVALAGVAPCGPVADRGPYLAWLAAASVAVPASSDLGIGLLARLYREHSAAGAMSAAADAWDALNTAVTTRFGCGVTEFARASEASTLHALMAREPLCLAGVLLHRGLEALQRGEPAEDLLADAVAAAQRLRTALRAIGSDDGDAEDVTFAATKELTVIAASRANAGIAERINALSAAGGARHAEAAASASFVTLVNRGAFDEARRVDAAMPPGWCSVAHAGTIRHADASVVYCRAVMELQLADGRRDEAQEWLKALRAALLRSFAAGDTMPASILYWPATEAAALGLRMSGSRRAATELVIEAQALAAQIAGFPARPAA